jgi:acyl dehydratase
MSSRGAAKKLAKPSKADGRAKTAKAAKGARAKPAKKPLARVTSLPKQPKAAAKPAQPPAPPQPAFMGLRPQAPPGARPPPPARPPPARPPPAAQQPPLPRRGAVPVRPPLAQPPPRYAVAPRPPLPEKKPQGNALRSGALQTTPAKQSLARSFYWSELRVGDDLPPLPKPAVDRVQIARYAAAANDYNRLHLDEPFAQSLGFPGTFAPGALAMGFVGQLLTAWLRRGHVRRLSARFVKLIRPGDELTAHGRVADLRKDGGACYAEIELWTENQKGELVLRGQATCELYESPGAGSADGAGLLFALDQGRGSPQAQGQAARPGGSRPPPSRTPERPTSKPPAAPKKK